MVRRVAEPEQVRVVEERAGETGPGALAARQRADLAIAKRVQAEAGKDPAEGLLEGISAGVLEVMLRVGVSLEERGIAGRELVLHGPELLLELAEVFGRAAGVLLDRAVHVDEELLLQEADPGAAGERDRTTVRRVEARDDPQEGRLPRPVRADQAGAVAVGEVEAHVAEQHAVGEAATGCLDREDAHPIDRVRGARWHRGQW